MTFDVPLTEELDLDRLREAVEPVRDEVYRIKGFADVGGRRFHVDYSSTQWNCEEVAGGPPPALVSSCRGPCSPAVRQLIRTLRPDIWQSESTTPASRLPILKQTHWRPNYVDAVTNPPSIQEDLCRRTGTVKHRGIVISLCCWLAFAWIGRVQASAAELQPLVGVQYFAGWWPTDRQDSKWLGRDRQDWRGQYPGRVPLLGGYNDQATMDREIAAAADYGVDFFSILWYAGEAEPQRELQESLLNRGLEHFLKSPQAPRLKFMIEYVNHPPFGVTSDAQWQRCVDTWIQAIRHPSYLRVGGKPVLKVHGGSLFLKQAGGNPGQSKTRLDSSAKRRGRPAWASCSSAAAWDRGKRSRPDTGPPRCMILAPATWTFRLRRHARRLTHGICWHGGPQNVGRRTSRMRSHKPSLT